MKYKVTKEDLHSDAFGELSCAVDLFNTIQDEHFASVNMPEGWGDESTYECVSRKIRAVAVIANNAIDKLSMAESDGAGNYFEAVTRLMADIIRGRREGIA